MRPVFPRALVIFLRIQLHLRHSILRTRRTVAPLNRGLLLFWTPPRRFVESLGSNGTLACPMKNVLGPLPRITLGLQCGHGRQPVSFRAPDGIDCFVQRQYGVTESGLKLADRSLRLGQRPLGPLPGFLLGLQRQLGFRVPVHRRCGTPRRRGIGTIVAVPNNHDRNLAVGNKTAPVRLPIGRPRSVLRTGNCRFVIQPERAAHVSLVASDRCGRLGKARCIVHARPEFHRYLSWGEGGARQAIHCDRRRVVALTSGGVFRKVRWDGNR
jgi:hypothetical protein